MPLLAPGCDAVMLSKTLANKEHFLSMKIPFITIFLSLWWFVIKAISIEIFGSHKARLFFHPVLLLNIVSVEEDLQVVNVGGWKVAKWNPSDCVILYHSLL